MDSSRPFGGNRTLPSGRYQARCWHLGKQVPADTTFATKADARAWLATMETDLLSGRHVDPSSGRERFGVFAERWLEARDLRPHAEAVEIEVSHAEACPVCRWPGLMEEAWREHSPSHEICPSCGTEFGYDDAIGLTDRDALAARHSSLRQSWERGGREWWSDSRKAPAGWQARRP